MKRITESKYPLQMAKDKEKIEALEWDIDKKLEFNLSDEERIEAEQTIKKLLLSTKREGIEDLIKWLEQTHFFMEPASANHHLCCEGGLAWHSLSVYNTLKKIVDTGLYGTINEDTMILTALLHDVCKIGTYQPTVVKRQIFTKDGSESQWINYSGYVNKEDFPYGHGEKSVTLIQDYIHLTNEEKMMIRWHMGAFSDSYSERNGYSDACKKCHSVLALQMADMTSSSVIEEDYVLQN